MRERERVRESISRRQAIKNGFIAGVKKKKKKKSRTQIVIQVLLTPGHCGLLLDKIRKKKFDIYSRNILRIYACCFMFCERVV